MEILNQNGITKRISMQSKKVTSLAVVVTAAGALFSYNHFRNQFSASSISERRRGAEQSWFNKFIMKKPKTTEPSLSEAIMNKILRYNEVTNKFDKQRPGKVSWFETNHIKANNPLEDRHCECYLKFNKAYLFGIFDGHSGWHCSESLRTRLPLYISLALTSKEHRNQFILNKTKSDNFVEFLSQQSDDELSFEIPPTFKDKQKRIQTGSDNFVKAIDELEKVKTIDVNNILKYTYLYMDRDISLEAIPDGICNEPLWNGLSGAVAVTAYVKDDDLYVSNTGDCRAVLGRQSSNGTWLNVAMSQDHVVGNREEVNRIKDEHPNENQVIHQGRLLGQLQPLRSFGDVPYKWSIELHRKVLDLFYGQPRVPKSIYRTPPYLTAEPDVTYSKISDGNSFLILGTDGLWDTVTNQMAVKIIGSYLDDIKNNVVPDENGATQLIRYALGGGSNTRLADMLKLPQNIKRRYHDDITVTVVYFDNEYRNLKSKL